MRRRRMTGILLILLLVFAAGYFAADMLNSSEVGTNIYSFESGSIASIHIKSPDNGVSFEKVGDEWAIVEPAAYKTDGEMVRVLANKLESLDAIRVIEKRTNDLNKYGLDNPRLSVTLSLINGTEKTLLIGEETASKYQYYVKDSQKDVICTLSHTDVEAFGNGDPSVFRDRNLFYVDKNNINVFCLYHNEKIDMLLLQYETGKWEFSEPFKANAKNDFVNDILKKIGELKIKDFIDDAPSDLDKYGLDKPVFSIEVGDRNGKLQKISFGDIDYGKKEAFLCVDDEKVIYTVPIDSFNPNDINLADLLNEAPLSVAIDSVKSIMINDKGVVSEFIRDTSKQDEDIFIFNGEMVSKDDFIALYVNMMALTSDGYDGADVKRTTEMTIVYKSMEGDDTIKLELSARDDKSYFLTVDDDPLPFYVSAQKVELVRRWMSKVTGKQGVE